MRYDKIINWYRSLSEEYPIRPCRDMIGRYIMNEATVSRPGNRMVWIVDRQKHQPIAVVFDASKSGDPLVITMTSELDRVLYQRELKKRALGKEEK